MDHFGFFLFRFNFICSIYNFIRKQRLPRSSRVFDKILVLHWMWSGIGFVPWLKHVWEISRNHNRPLLRRKKVLNWSRDNNDRAGFTRRERKKLWSQQQPMISVAQNVVCMYEIRLQINFLALFDLKMVWMNVEKSNSERTRARYQCKQRAGGKKALQLYLNDIYVPISVNKITICDKNPSANIFTLPPFIAINTRLLL